MERTTIVLAGDFSRKLGEDKNLIKIAGKSLIAHIVDCIRILIDEVHVVISSDNHKKVYSPTL